MRCDNTERAGGTDEEWRHECDDKNCVRKDVRSPTKRNTQQTINTNEDCAQDMHASDDDVRSDWWRLIWQHMAFSVAGTLSFVDSFTHWITILVILVLGNAAIVFSILLSSLLFTSPLPSLLHFTSPLLCLLHFSTLHLSSPYFTSPLLSSLYFTSLLFTSLFSTSSILLPPSHLCRIFLAACFPTCPCCYWKYPDPMTPPHPLYGP